MIRRIMIVMCLLVLAVQLPADSDFPKGKLAVIVNGENISQKELLRVLEVCYGKELAPALSMKVVHLALKEMIIFKIIKQKKSKKPLKIASSEYIENFEFYETPFFIDYKIWAMKNPIMFREVVEKIMKHDKNSKDTKWKNDGREAWKKIYKDKKLKKYLRREVYRKYHVNYKLFKKRVKLITEFQKQVEATISEKEIAKFAKKEKFALQNGMVNMRHILVLTIDRVTNEPFSKEMTLKSLKKIEGISQKIKSKGKNFGEIAFEHSEDDLTRYRQGKLGWIPRWPPSTLFGGFLYHVGWIPDWTTLVPEILETAYHLPVNKVSKPIKSKLGYHLVFVTEKKPGKKMSEQEILKRARKRLLHEKMEKLLRKWMKESKIEVKL